MILRPLPPSPLWEISPGPRGGHSARLNKMARAIPGMTKSEDLPGAWVGYPDAMMRVAGTLKKIGVALPTIGRLEDSLRAPGDHHSYLQPGPLRDYQHEGAAFLLANPRSILADDMGLGKSLTAIEAAQNTPGDPPRVLIVCPSYVRDVWVSEIDKWGASEFADPLLLRGKGPKDATPLLGKIIICHYEILAGWADALKAWGPVIVILDEAHLLGDLRNKRSQAASRLSEMARYVWMLTGTPLTNRPRDIWPLVEILTPGRFGPFPHFGIRYCGGVQTKVETRDGPRDVWDFSGSSREAELAARLKSLMLRRTKAQVALALPALTRQVVPLNIPRVPRFGGESFRSESGARRALDLAADAKLRPAIEWLRGALAGSPPQSKRVVFCWRRAVAEEIATALGPTRGAELIHGGISASRRGAALNRFRDPGGPRLLVATIDAAGTGIDLTAATAGTFVELTWEPHEILQAESRLHRFGAVEPVTITYLIGSGTIDEIVTDMLIKKLGLQEKIIGNQGDLRSDLQGDPALDPLLELQRLHIARVETRVHG